MTFKTQIVVQPGDKITIHKNLVRLTSKKGTTKRVYELTPTLSFYLTRCPLVKYASSHKKWVILQEALSLYEQHWNRKLTCLELFKSLNYFLLFGRLPVKCTCHVCRYYKPKKEKEGSMKTP
jgi:hypothetical protein